MRRIIVSALIAIVGLLSIATPASAGPAPVTAASGCSTSHKSQSEDGITVDVTFTYANANCQVSRVQVYNYAGSRYGHFYLFGPDGWSSNSATKTWANGEPFTQYPWMLAWGGQLWCGKFFDGNLNPVTGNICVTV